MNLIPGKEKEYAEYVQKNGDPYGAECVKSGEAVMALLDEGKSPEEAEKALYGRGLTGFMAGAAISGVVHFHQRGQEMKAWWNRKNPHGESDEMSGTNNPAIVTLNI